MIEPEDIYFHCGPEAEAICAEINRQEQEAIERALAYPEGFNLDDPQADE